MTELVEGRIESVLTDYKWLMGHLMVAESNGGKAVIPAADLEAVGKSMQQTHALLTAMIQQASAGNSQVDAAMEKVRERQAEASAALKGQAASAEAALKSVAPLAGGSSDGGSE